MGDPSNSTSGKHQNSALDDPTDGPRSKAQKTSTSSESTIDDSSTSCPGVLTTVLESEASASIRKEENEDSCPILKLSRNDELKLIFGYAGEKQYGFVACVSDRFHQAHLETFGGETSTSIESAAESVSRAQLCLGTERPNCDTRAIKLFQAAAKNGQLEVLKWGQGSGYELESMLDKGDISCVAKNGHLEVVKYLREIGVSWDENTCAGAANGGHLELLKWARVNQCPWNELTCTEAACSGHLALLKWARANRCPWNEETCSHAAAYGRLDLLKWARANQCPWDEETCSYAAADGHLELLKWARANQCPWNEETCTEAAANGHLELLKWAKLNGCPWDADTNDVGQENGDPALMRYLEDHGLFMM
jgi:hypothetical protein